MLASVTSPPLPKCRLVNSKCDRSTAKCPPSISCSYPAMTMDDDQLRALIEQARNPDSSPLKTRKALTRLLTVVSQLPGILRSSHQDYPVALNKTVEWFRENLSEFKERPPSLEKSLVVWINGYLKWRIKDLYIQDQQKLKTEKSLNEPINKGDDNIGTLEARLPDSTPSLSNIDAYIEAQQAKRKARHGQWVEQYIEQDPEGKLVSCHPKKYPECNGQRLAKRILLKDPPDRISTLALEFNIPRPTLDSHWKRLCLPLLRDIANRYIELP